MPTWYQQLWDQCGASVMTLCLKYNVRILYISCIYVYFLHMCLCQSSFSSQICLKGRQDLMGFMMDLCGHLGELSTGECLFRA